MPRGRWGLAIGSARWRWEKPPIWRCGILPIRWNSRTVWAITHRSASSDRENTMQEITLNRETLDIETLWRFSQAALDPKARIKIRIDAKAMTRIKAAEKFVHDLAHSGDTVYGLN